MIIGWFPHIDFGTNYNLLMLIIGLARLIKVRKAERKSSPPGLEIFFIIENKNDKTIGIYLLIKKYC